MLFILATIGFIVPIQAEPDFNYSDLITAYDTDISQLYYKVIVPDDSGNQWNLSLNFAESKPVIFLPNLEPHIRGYGYYYNANKPVYYAWICCNISKGDRLYTTDATNDSTLRGTLTNLYNINYKTRLYFAGFWVNYYIGASTIPDVYNRRGKLHIDGTQVAWSMETRNVSVVGVPELMKVFLI